MSKGFSTSSVGRKILMALSGFFLLFFLLQHFVINFLSVLSPDAFNETSHFMGDQPTYSIFPSTCTSFWSFIPFRNGHLP